MEYFVGFSQGDLVFLQEFSRYATERGGGWQKKERVGGGEGGPSAALATTVPFALSWLAESRNYNSKNI